MWYTAKNATSELVCIQLFKSLCQVYDGDFIVLAKA